MPKKKKTTAQTGAWGVLLVQQQLLKQGIDSAPMTTDRGIDLLAYDQETKKSFSIQVKTRAGKPNERRPDWKVRCGKCGDADLYAFALQARENEKCAVWYIGQEFLSKELIKQGRDRALTFYLEDVPKRKRVPLAQRFDTYKNDDPGLKTFVDAWREKQRRYADARAWAIG